MEDVKAGKRAAEKVSMVLMPFTVKNVERDVEFTMKGMEDVKAGKRAAERILNAPHALHGEKR